MTQVFFYMTQVSFTHDTHLFWHMAYVASTHDTGPLLQVTQVSFWIWHRSLSHTTHISFDIWHTSRIFAHRTLTPPTCRLLTKVLADAPAIDEGTVCYRDLCTCEKKPMSCKKRPVSGKKRPMPYVKRHVWNVSVEESCGCACYRWRHGMLERLTVYVKRDLCHVKVKRDLCHVKRDLCHM